LTNFEADPSTRYDPTTGVLGARY